MRRLAAGQGVTGNATPSLVTGVRLPGIGKVIGVKSAGRIRAAPPTAQACWEWVDATPAKRPSCPSRGATAVG